MAEDPVPPFTDHQARALRALVSRLVPASAAFRVPGADDEAIFADILGALAPDAAATTALLDALDRETGGDFAALNMAARDAAYQRQAADPGFAAVLAATMLCYYRDDRVMVSLGLEPRPPFPKGFEVEEGDWSLLDPVRARPQLWRPAPQRSESPLPEGEGGAHGGAMGG
jgi:hypothetical protein